MTARTFQCAALILAGGLLGLAPMTQTLAAAPSFDGNWSVAVVAESGDCSARYTVPIEISGGQVRYSGRFNADASGKVGSAGQLNVSFSYRDDVVQAKGALTEKNGYGSWTSPTQECGGTWRAHRA